VVVVLRQKVAIVLLTGWPAAACDRSFERTGEEPEDLFWSSTSFFFFLVWWTFAIGCLRHGGSFLTAMVEVCHFEFLFFILF
jgi:hypothetical protein